MLLQKSYLFLSRLNGKSILEPLVSVWTLVPELGKQLEAYLFRVEEMREPVKIHYKYNLWPPAGGESPGQCITLWKAGSPSFMNETAGVIFPLLSCYHSLSWNPPPQVELLQVPLPPTCCLSATVWPLCYLKQHSSFSFPSSCSSRKFLRFVACLSWDIFILNSNEFVFQSVLR